MIRVTVQETFLRRQQWLTQIQNYQKNGFLVESMYETTGGLFAQLKKENLSNQQVFQTSNCTPDFV